MPLEKASETLFEAKANLEEGRFSSAIIIAYVVVLNTGRAVLFRDGYLEKSHYCILRYLEGKYGNQIGVNTIIQLDSYRQMRHDT